MSSGPVNNSPAPQRPAEADADAGAPRDNTVAHREHDSNWTFLTNHTHVLACLARDPDTRLRDVAQMVGITERAVQKIVSDLEHSQVLIRSRDGRRNHYEIRRDPHLRHPVEQHCSVGELLDLINKNFPDANGSMD
jgi:hypothetical protein